MSYRSEMTALILAGLLVVTPVVWATVSLAAEGGEESSSGRSETTLYEKGVKKTNAGEYARAEELFRESIRDEQSVAESYNMLGYVLRQQGRYDAAINAYKQALDRRPNFPEAREYLGEAYLKKARHQLDWLRENAGEDHETTRKLSRRIQQLADQLQSDNS